MGTEAWKGSFDWEGVSEGKGVGVMRVGREDRHGRKRGKGEEEHEDTYVSEFTDAVESYDGCNA